MGKPSCRSEVEPHSLFFWSKCISRLAERVAIITGGGRGIGRAIAKRFAAEGAAIVIADQHAENGHRTSQEIQTAGGIALFIQTDVADRASVETLVEQTQAQFNRIDILGQ